MILHRKKEDYIVYQVTVVPKIIILHVNHLQTKRDLETLVDELNAGRPQCPVGLNTLVIPRKLSTAHQDLNQPYVYLNCGHVQGNYC